MKYDIVLNGITYTVTAYSDDGAIFANIHSASGLDNFGADELPELFNEETHEILTAVLRRIMSGQS